MDVTCERCGTEYEFDETLLSGRGTSVKCTNCGQVFKVYPKSRDAADGTTSTWRLRLRNGSVDEIDSLRELQRRISSGELKPENEISRGAEGWKPLGSIPELETFFQAVGIRVASPRIPSPLPPVPSTRAAAPGARDSSLPPGRRPRQPTLLGVSPVQRVLPDGAASAPTRVSTPESRSRSAPAAASASASIPNPSAPVPDQTPYESPYASDPAPSPAAHRERRSEPFPADIEDAVFEDAAPTANRPSLRPSTPPPAYHDDDDDIPGLPGRRGSPLLWLILIVAIGGLALIAAQWPRIETLLGIGSDPALIAAGASEGDASLAEGHPEAYASAIEAYGRALAAGGDRDPQILASLSRASALAAQAQLDARGAAGSITSLVANAMSAAESASALDPHDVDPKLALADALRLSGENAEARLLLEEARAMSFSRTAEFFRVDALLGAAEADGDLQHGLRSARQAAELAPHGVPYLLLLARAERASGDESAARIPLETILADHPDHPVAAALLAEMDATLVVADAGVPVDGGLASDAGEAAAEAAKGAETAVDTVPAAGPASKTELEPDRGTAAAPGAKLVSEARQAPIDKSADEKTPSPAPTRRRQAARDEYDRLAEAAGDDAFVDGRPPVRDYDWYMREGNAELAAGNYSRARALFDSALEASPGSADAMDGLGKVSVQIEEFDLAIRYFRVAAQRGQPDGYFNLAKVYERLDRKEEAVSAYYTYLKRRPTGSHAASARLAIKTLEPRAKLPPELDPSPQTGTVPSSEPSRAEEPTQDSEPTTP